MKTWKKTDHRAPGPERVSIHGALPAPAEAYEIASDGWTIYDERRNTYSNYFFGKVGIESQAEAEAIIARLEGRETPPEPERLVLVINGGQLWTDFGGLEQEVVCSTEEWAEDLAKLTRARIETGSHTIRAAIHAAGFKPCQ